MRLLVAAAAIPALLSGALCLAGEASRAPHPHFNDGGTLSWSTKLADAQKAAGKAGKLIFVEYGREK